MTYMKVIPLFKKAHLKNLEKKKKKIYFEATQEAKLIKTVTLFNFQTRQLNCKWNARINEE